MNSSSAQQRMGRGGVWQGALLVALCLTLGTACDRGGSKATEIGSESPGDGAAAVKPGEGAPPTARTPDPGPLLTRKTGTVAPQEAKAVAVAADAVARTKDASFVSVAMPTDIGVLAVGGPPMDAQLVVEGGRVALAVPSGEGRLPDRALMFVRFHGGEPPPDTFSVVWRQPAEPGGIAGFAQRFEVVGVNAAEPIDRLAKQFHDAAAAWFETRGSLGGLRGEPFYSFAAGRLRMVGEFGRGPLPADRGRSARGDISEAMNFYSGLTSVEEALQMDRGLFLSDDVGQTRDKALAEVRPVEIPGHPWDELIAEASGGAPLKIEPLAQMVPAEFLYVHFHDLRTFVKLAHELDTLIDPLQRVIEERGGTGSVIPRYETQLVLERLGMAEKLGQLATDGVALVASDPFIREGTDLTVLFRVRNAALLEGTLATFESRARARRPDATVQSWALGDLQVRHLSTADRAIDQHRVRIGEVLLVSNSRPAVERIARVAAGEGKRLADSGDFRYFRALFPFDTQQEDGFVFISDDLVAHVISPRMKILQARRSVAAAELSAVANGALLTGWMTGRFPDSVKAMLDAGWVRKEELVHRFEGDAIRFEPTSGPRSVWGSMEGLRPLIEIPLERVSERESGAYARFAEGYQRYWRTFIDPIGVRIRRRADGSGFDLDAKMMPLIERSDYREVEQMVGQTRLAFGKLGDGMRLTLGVGATAGLRREIDQIGRATLGSRDIGIGWLGEWVMIGVADRSGLWDMGLAMGEIPSAESRRSHTDGDLRKRVYDRFPLFLGAEVKDRLALAATLTALRAMADSAAPGVLDWGPGQPYRGVEVVSVREKMEGDGVQIHYAIPGKVLLIAVERGALEAQIDAALDGHLTAAAKEGADGGQAELVVRPHAGESWLARTLAGTLERGTLLTTRAAYRAHEALARGLGDALPLDPAAQDALARALLGYAPTCPNGGRLSADKTGEVSDPHYGTEVTPAWPEVPVPGSPLAAFLDGLDELRMTLSYEGEGRTRALRTTLHWSRRVAK